jgi:hypothetical protein
MLTAPGVCRVGKLDLATVTPRAVFALPRSRVAAMTGAATW